MSFSQETKNNLCTISCKKRCCKHAMMYGMLLFANTFQGGKIKLITENEKLSELFSGLMRSLFNVTTDTRVGTRKSGKEVIPNYIISANAQEPFFKYCKDASVINEDVFECPVCVGSFLRGAFLSGGTITDPMAGYHLEISTPSNILANSLCDVMNQNGLMSKVSVRKSRSAVYFKDSELIEDFLTFVGAQNAALNMMNTKIMRDIRNNENRRSNCDAANIFKITGSAKEQTDAINKLKKSGEFDSLPKDLKDTAELRLAYPFESLNKLAEMHQPKITKSGVNHRLKKIIELANK